MIIPAQRSRYGTEHDLLRMKRLGIAMLCKFDQQVSGARELRDDGGSESKKLDCATTPV